PRAIQSGGGDAATAQPGTDAGVDVDPGPLGPFYGAGPFVAQTVTDNANKHHKEPITGQACAPCHDGAGEGPRLLIAGPGYAGTDAGATTTGLAGAQVRVVDSTGRELANAYSDSDGNFWVLDKIKAIVPNSMAGVRNSTAMKAMPDRIEEGGCAQQDCHT